MHDYTLSSHHLPTVKSKFFAIDATKTWTDRFVGALGGGRDRTIADFPVRDHCFL
jgi:hypothetical protein